MAQQVDTVMQLIRNHYSDPQFNVASLAEKMGKSTSCLRELVYPIYGMGVQKLIETIRLEQAIKQLAFSDDVIGLVGYKNGYVYSKTFREAFKKRFNLTPQECKEIILKADDRHLEMERLLNVLWNSANEISR